MWKLLPCAISEAFRWPTFRICRRRSHIFGGHGRMLSSAPFIRSGYAMSLLSFSQPLRIAERTADSEDCPLCFLTRWEL
eukprot:IDg9085t1